MPTYLSVVCAYLLCAVLALPAHAATEPKRNYDLPANDAAAAFRQFSDVSGREILFAAEAVRGIRTHPVRGSYTAREALERMLAGTPLRIKQDERTGALAVVNIPTIAGQPKSASAAEVSNPSESPKKK